MTVPSSVVATSKVYSVALVFIKFDGADGWIVAVPDSSISDTVKPTISSSLKVTV